MWRAPKPENTSGPPLIQDHNSMKRMTKNIYLLLQTCDMTRNEEPHLFVCAVPHHTIPANEIKSAQPHKGIIIIFKGIIKFEANNRIIKMNNDEIMTFSSPSYNMSPVGAIKNSGYGNSSCKYIV